MAKYLAQLLGEPEAQFSRSISALEIGSGGVGIDIRLTSELRAAGLIKLGLLGLDPADTTGEELFFALKAKTANDDKVLISKFENTGAVTTATAMYGLVEEIKPLIAGRTAWVMKRSVAKQLIKTNPPKLVMSKLHYRSISSLIKNESVSEILWAAKLLEDKKWHKNFVEQYKNLRASDFEEREVELTALSSKRWADLAYNFIASTGMITMSVAELGAIAVMPLNAPYTRGFSITLLVQIVQQLNNIHALAAYFKLHQVQPGFGKIVRSVIAVREVPSVAQIADVDIAWVDLLWSMKNGSSEYFDELEPRLTRTDINIYDSGNLLQDLHPQLDWWVGSGSYGAVVDNIPVSFNLQDCVYNLISHQTLAKRQLYGLRTDLRSELLGRYLGLSVYARQILKQLDKNGLSADAYSVSEVDEYQPKAVKSRPKYTKKKAKN